MELPESIKKPLDAVTNAIVDRFRNPFAASFIISWVLFNWKPIIFLILAAHPVEWSIKYIETQFTNQSHYLWFPLCSAVIYSVVLPYISVGIDLLLKYYISYRNKSLVYKQVQSIRNKKEIVEAQVDLEEAEKDRRELRTQNKLNADKEAKIKSLEDQLEKLSKESTDSYNALKERAETAGEFFTTSRQDMEVEIEKLKGHVQSLENELRISAQSNKSEISKYMSEVSGAKGEANQYKKTLDQLTHFIDVNRSKISVTTLNLNDNKQRVLQLNAPNDHLNLLDNYRIIGEGELNEMISKI